MNRKRCCAWLSMLLFAITAAAQTTVTTSGGTTNSVPAFTGSATLGNSPISISGGNVGIGLGNPSVPLDVVGYLHVTGNTNPSTVVQGAYFSWNALTGGYGETDFINNQGGGYGGFAFMNTPSSGSPRTTLMLIDGANGDVGIGTTWPSAKLEVDGGIKLTSGSGGSITFPDGTVQSTAYTGVACGGDYAESVKVQGNRHHYEPGDVLVISDNSNSDVALSQKPYSTRVVGVYSTKPGYVGRRFTGPKSKQEVPMAMIGIVPVKVTAANGPIRRGDLLVTSSTPGYAMRGTDRGRMLGAVLGKALGNLNSGNGVIEAVVTLQ